MKKTVGILNLGISNTESIKSAINFLGFDSKLINIEEDFDKFAKIIIPGNGSFPSIAKNFLNNRYKKKLIQYIEKNNHLPDVPSAQEMEKQNGFEIGEMQTLLVKKLEEANLYILQLNKRVSELESKLK